MNITIEVSTEEKAETIRAFAQAVETGSIEGIQFWSPISNSWHDKKVLDMALCAAYRRKPSPTYRPWTPEEAIGKVVKHVTGDLVRVITSASYGCVHFDSGLGPSLEGLHQVYAQLDGSTCGVLEGGEA